MEFLTFQTLRNRLVINDANSLMQQKISTFTTSEFSTRILNTWQMINKLS